MCRLVGEEGYGSSVVCPVCDLASRKETCSTMRAGIKRNQESLHQRMLKASSKKFKPAYRKYSYNTNFRAGQSQLFGSAEYYWLHYW